MAFNRNGGGRGGDRGGFRSRPSFGGGRPRFGDRGDRGPVEMHKAICDNCGKECEVPFRPTSGKPVYCSSCFEHKGGSDSPRFASDAGRRFEGRGSEDRPMFDAVCADCGNECKVPFRPTGDKPVFCSNCFGGKKNVEGSTGGNGGSRVNLEELNAKLDKILGLLSPLAEQSAPAVEEVPVEAADKPVKSSKKKSKAKVKEVVAPVTEE